MQASIYHPCEPAGRTRFFVSLAVVFIVAMAGLAWSMPALAQEAGADGRSIPGWLSILPPVIAIALALLTRQVIPSLAAGIWVGAWFANELSLYGIWGGLLDVFDTWTLQALAPPDGDTSHMSIILFTMMIGGMVGIIYRNGGALAIVEKLTAGRIPGVGAKWHPPVSAR